MNKKLFYLEGWLSIIINVVLFVAKLLVGLLTNSIAIIADAWHTLSDSLTSIVVIIGARASSKPRDREHPFGHERIELVASIIIGTLLFLAGINFLMESVKKLVSAESFTFHPSIIIVFAVSVVLKEGIARFSFWAAGKTRSTTLKADGWHHRSDAIASGLILLGVFIGKYLWWIDGVLGIIVAGLIAATAVSIVKEAVNPLIGENIDDKTRRDIEEIVFSHLDRESRPHHFHYHKYGSHKELSFHIYLDGEMKIDEGHRVTDAIEEQIRKLLNIESTIHVESSI